MEEYIGKKAATWFANQLIKALTALAVKAPDLITLGVVVCSFGLMVSGSNRWLERMGALIGIGLGLMILF